MTGVPTFSESAEFLCNGRKVFIAWNGWVLQDFLFHVNNHAFHLNDTRQSRACYFYWTCGITLTLSSFPPTNAAPPPFGLWLPRWGTCRALWKAVADWHLGSSWWQGHFLVVCSTSASGWRDPECAWTKKQVRTKTSSLGAKRHRAASPAYVKGLGREHRDLSQHILYQLTENSSCSSPPRLLRTYPIRHVGLLPSSAATHLWICLQGSDSTPWSSRLLKSLQNCKICKKKQTNIWLKRWSRN